MHVKNTIIANAVKNMHLDTGLNANARAGVVCVCIRIIGVRAYVRVRRACVCMRVRVRVHGVIKKRTSIEYSMPMHALGWCVSAPVLGGGCHVTRTCASHSSSSLIAAAAALRRNALSSSVRVCYIQIKARKTQSYMHVIGNYTDS